MKTPKIKPLLTKPLLLLLLALLLPAAAAAQHVKISVEGGRGNRSIAVGDQFYLKIVVSDLDGQPAQPSAVPGAKVIYFARTGQSSSFQSINGKTSQSTSTIYTATLRAEKEGKYSFGPVTVAGVKSNTVNYSIGAAGSNGSPSPDPRSSAQSQGAAGHYDPSAGPMFIGKGDGNLFLRASVSKTTAYEQEALVYTVKLYTSYSALKFIGATTDPKFEGFVIEQSKDISQSLTAETYQGKTYATAIIARYIIFPQMTGTLKIIGNKYTVSVDEREYYHDPFWGQMSVSKPLQLNVTPNDLSIEVKALPQPVPADFSGGVGRFSITSSMPTTTLKSNEAAQIVYTVSGTGNIKYVKLPELSDIYPKEIEVYSPTTDVKANVGSSSVSGSVKFDYSFLPLETGSYHIPAVRLVYFDPSTGKYEEATAKGYDITVGKGLASAKSQTRSQLKFDPTLMRDVTIEAKYVPYVEQPLYWLFYIVPVVLLVAAILAYRKYVSLNADLGAVKARRAAAEARKRLKRARDCMRRGDEEHFYDELLAGIWGYLGDKLKIAPSDLSRENVSDLLRNNGVSDDDIARVIDLVDRAEYAKYTPMDAETGMQQMLDQATELISLLQTQSKTAPNEQRVMNNE